MLIHYVAQSTTKFVNKNPLSYQELKLRTRLEKVVGAFASIMPQTFYERTKHGVKMFNCH